MYVNNKRFFGRQQESRLYYRIINAYNLRERSSISDSAFDHVDVTMSSIQQFCTHTCCHN